MTFTLGEAFQLSKSNPLRKKYPTMRPIMGEISNVTRIFINPGSRIAFQPAPITTAPTNPPTNACDELDGNPRYQVNKFHKIALDKAAKITTSVIVSAATTSCPMV